MRLFTADFDDIRSGKVTDVYFERTLKILEAKGIRKNVRAEFAAKSLPGGWGVFTGLEEILRLLEGFPVDVRAVPEGTVFGPAQPVLEITGTYNDFCRLETPILGLMCQASGVATKAARCRIAAEGRQLVSFGARRMHPAIAPMVERAAYVGGCDGVALVKGAELLEIPAAGDDAPRPGDSHGRPRACGPRRSMRLSSRRWGRVALVDTFADERFETLEAARALTDRLSAVRVDTPASRRGNLYQILEEIRWELDRRGSRT